MRKSVVVAGQRISYRELGSHGPTIILVHGYGGSPEHFNTISLKLSEYHRVIIPNLTPLYLNPKLFYTFQNQVSIFTEFLTLVGGDLKGVHLMASSYGGALAWASVIHRPDLVSSMALVSPMPPHPFAHLNHPTLRYFLRLGRWPLLLVLWLLMPFGKAALPKLAEIFQISLLDEKVRGKKRKPLSFKKLKLLVHLFVRFNQIIRRENWAFWESQLYQVKIPICLIWGTEDRLFSSEEPHRLHKVFSSSNLYFVNEAGHLAMREHPELVFAIVEKFFIQKKFEEFVA